MGSDAEPKSPPFSRVWWVEKAAVPLCLLVLTALLTQLVVPRILAERDRLARQDRAKYLLADEIMLETTGVMATMYSYETALDDYYQRRHAHEFMRARTEAATQQLPEPERYDPDYDRGIEANMFNVAYSRYVDGYHLNEAWRSRLEGRMRLLYGETEAVFVARNWLEREIVACDSRLADKASAYRDAFKALRAAPDLPSIRRAGEKAVLAERPVLDFDRLERSADNLIKLVQATDLRVLPQ